VEKKLAVLIEITDEVIVVESLEPYHHDGARYLSEAKSLARDALPFFNPAGDYYLLPSFKQGDANWHPVFSNWNYFSDFEHLKDPKSGYTITRLGEHSLKKRFVKVLPLETRRRFKLTEDQ
jgi:hypothetical protein